MKLYGLGGLGTDERVFSTIDLPVEYIPWTIPDRLDDISSYAKKMATVIDQSEPYTLIGISFGGFIASEMNNFLSPEKTILISSAGRKSELPFTLRNKLTGLLPFVFPPDFFLKGITLFPSIIGVDRNHLQLLKQMNNDIDRKVLTWCMKQIGMWKNEVLPSNLIRIHAEQDHIIPMKKGIDYHIIKGAGHFMPVTHGPEIKAIIQKSQGL